MLNNWELKTSLDMEMEKIRMLNWNALIWNENWYETCEIFEMYNSSDTTVM